MIVRRRLKWSIILRNSWKSAIYWLFLSSGVFLLHEVLGYKQVSLPYLPINTLGTALAIFLAFRNNTSYDRWWEARKIWGEIVNYSRTLGRQVTTLISLTHADKSISVQQLKQLHKELIYRHIAWINALRIQLREQDYWQEVRPLLSEAEYDRLMRRQNKATQLIQRQGERLSDAFEKKLIDGFRYIRLDETLTELYNMQGKCERIKNTPLPRQYDYFTRLFVHLFITLLPFGLIEILSNAGIAFLVVPATILISFVFFVLERIGYLNEDPFENRITDTPMTALCRTIEIDLREQLGEHNLPPALEPVDGFLY